MEKRVDTFIQTMNAFDVEGALALFQFDAVIEDASVGDTFAGADGIRRYLEQFFVGYNTASKLLSLEQKEDFTAIARLDFTGDFGHEVGSLSIKVSSDGLFERIVADLEQGSRSAPDCACTSAIAGDGFISQASGTPRKYL